MENSVGDLISRERLRKMIKATKKQAEKFRNQDYWTGYVVALSTMEGVIADIPAIDAVPVVHGRWEDTPIGIIKCSLCGRCYNLYKGFAKYCPNCGARMDEEGG